jgi:WD40 repeat protein
MADLLAIRKRARPLRDHLRGLLDPRLRDDTLTRREIAQIGNLSEITVRKIEDYENPSFRVSGPMVGRYLKVMIELADDLLPRVSAENQGAFRAALAELRHLLTQVTGEASLGPTHANEALPYPVLGRYEDPATFGGRAREVAHVVERLLSGPPILGLFAESGVGKSSLLEAGVAPALRALGRAVGIWRTPGGSELARHLGEVFGAEVEGTEGWLEWLADQPQPPIIVLDQFEEVFRFNQLAELEALLAATTRDPRRPLCRWLLAYRQEYHGEVRVWLEKPLPGLPEGLLDPLRFVDWPLPPLGAGAGLTVDLDSARKAFFDAISRPLDLKGPDGRPRFAWSMAPIDMDKLALLFARARVDYPTDPLTPELQVVLARLCDEAGPERVLRPPAPIDGLLERALERHVLHAIEAAFPPRRDGGGFETRTRALLALRRMVHDGKRAEALHVEDLRPLLGSECSATLERFMRPTVRLVVCRVEADGTWCRLSHDRLAEVIVELANRQLAKGRRLDARLLRLVELVEQRATLFARSPDTALVVLEPGDFRAIDADQDLLIWRKEHRAWWAACVQFQKRRRRRRLGWMAVAAGIGVAASMAGVVVYRHQEVRQKRLLDQEQLEVRLSQREDPAARIALMRAQEALLDPTDAVDQGKRRALQAKIERAAREGGVSLVLKAPGSPLPASPSWKGSQDDRLDRLNMWVRGEQVIWVAQPDPDGRHVWTADFAGQVARFEVETGRLVDRWFACRRAGGPVDARDLRILPVSGGVAVACYSGHVIALQPGRPPKVLLSTSGQERELLYRLAVNQDESIIAASIEQRGWVAAYGQGLFHTSFDKETLGFEVQVGPSEVVGNYREGWHVARSNPSGLTVSDPKTGWRLALQPNGHLLAAARPEGTWRITLYDLRDEEAKAEVDTKITTLRHMVWSSDGASIVVGGSKEVLIFSLQALDEPVHLKPIHTDMVDALAVAPGRLFSSGWDGRVVQWDQSSGIPLAVGRHDGIVHDLRTTADGKGLASASQDGTARLWLQDGPLVHTLQVSRSVSKRLPNLVIGSGWLAAHTNEGIAVVEPGRTAWRLPVEGWPVAAEGEHLWVWDPVEGNIRRWHIKSLQPSSDLVAVRDFEGIVPGSGGGLFFNKEGVFEVASGRLRHSPPPRRGPWRVVARADGRLVFNVDNGSTTRADGETENPLFVETPAGLNSIEVGWGRDPVAAPLGTGIATAALQATGGFLVVPADRAPPKQCLGHSASLADLRFSPDGQTIASVGDGLRLWTHEGELLASFQREQQLARVAFSPDGSLVAVADRNGHVRIRPLAEDLAPYVIQEFSLAGSAPTVFEFLGDQLVTLSGQAVQVWRVPPYDPDRTRRELARRTNFRVCADSLREIPILPFPTDEDPWAPPWLCTATADRRARR